MLKKFSLIVSFVFVTLVAFGLTASSALAQADYQIYVHDVKTEKPVYSVGETVKGEFVVSNLADIAQSEIMYEVSSGLYNSNEMVLLTKQSPSPKTWPIYIKSKSKVTIPFEYKLPESLTGTSAIQVIAVLKDGTFVGQGLVPISVSGKANTENISIVGSILVINKSKDLAVSPNTGPTVYEDDVLEFLSVISSTTKKYTFTPTLSLYNRTDNNNALIKTINLPNIVTGSQPTELVVKLPVDLDPLVYYGVISFKTQDKAELADTSFRYIVAGPIATIRNITSEVLEAKKGTSIPFIVKYGSQPIDELRPEKQVKIEGATISVAVTNEKGEIVGNANSPIDLFQSEISLAVESAVKASSLSYSAVIKDSTGKILSEYKTDLPTKESLKDQKSYLPKSNFSLITLISAVLLLIIIAVLIYIRRKHKIVNVPLTILAFAFLLTTGLLGARDVKAWELFVGHIYSGSGHAGMFRVTSVASPVPDTIKMYNPGETFNLSFSTSFGDCNNGSEYFYAYRFKDGINWWSQTPTLSSTTNWTTDYTTNKAYWVNNGTELFSASGLSNHFNLTKTTCLALGYHWSTLFHFCIAPNIFAKTYSFSKQYTAPTTPGYHKMYFAIFQKGDDHGGNGIDDGKQNATYVQEICVKGAGVCYGESVVVSYCPNLVGTYTYTNGVVYDPSGQATSYVLDSSGNCVINHAPNAPTVTGPANSTSTVSTAFSASSTDQDGDTIRYLFDWDNNGVIDTYSPASGYVNSGVSQNGSNIWYSATNTSFKVFAQDEHGAISSPTSRSINIGSPFSTNSPPTAPVITGTTTGIVGVNYGFWAKSTDPDGDKIRYRFDWKDGGSPVWSPDYDYTTGTPPVAIPAYETSGVARSGNKTWTTSGTKTFEVTAVDEHGATSSMATHSIVIQTFSGFGDITLTSLGSPRPCEENYLSWNSNGAESYTLYRKKSGSSNWELVKSFSSTPFSMTYTDGPLVGGDIYAYYVNSTYQGLTKNSNTITLTAITCPECGTAIYDDSMTDWPVDNTLLCKLPSEVVLSSKNKLEVPPNIEFSWKCHIDDTYDQSCATNGYDSLSTECPQVDGITIASGTSMTFYSSRVSATCPSAQISCINGQLIIDPAGLILSDYRYRSCAIPKFNEF